MTYDHAKACAAQDQYCVENDKPHFAPYSGYCYACGADIYSLISVEEAGRRLITGCPFCHASYCD